MFIRTADVTVSLTFPEDFAAARSGEKPEERMVK